MADDYETFQLVWRERTVQVSYLANWLNSDVDHIELRCEERLPVTETGYRSYFVPASSFAGEEDITACIIDWLDTAADTKRHEEDRRQLKLF